MSRCAIVGNFLIDLDRVELVGQREPLDPRGQPGDRFFVLECFQSTQVGRPGSDGLAPDVRCVAPRLGAELC